jgi:hypothetical protein
VVFSVLPQSVQDESIPGDQAHVCCLLLLLRPCGGDRASVGTAAVRSASESDPSSWSCAI